MANYKGTRRLWRRNAEHRILLNPGSVGQIFYNSTSGTFKTVKPGGLPAGTWASGGDLNTARIQGGGDGSSTECVLAGGNVIHTVTAMYRTYNGTSLDRSK
jgi:hypothetical protein